MISSSNNRTQAIERAQPWLGTLVSVRVQGLAEYAAHRAIDAAFGEIAAVHRLMSFHDPQSDLSRLNRAATGNPVEVHPHTYEVLRQAMELSACTKGCFDVTVGAELVKWDLLPRPAGAGESLPGSWSDMELRSGNQVVVHRPLCIDLGGIGKGFAVDRATQRLRAHGAWQTVVNAGGDIRVQGQDAEPIQLSPESSQDRMPVLELRDGSVASSSGHLQRRWHRGRLCGPHVNGVHRTPAPTERFVCVIAERCIVADALTKVVMALGKESASVLRLFGASAYFHDPGKAWQYLEEERAIAG
jgi:FAD:protein FMN transferase